MTAREAGYREEAVFGDDFIRLDVQDLEENEIAMLIKNWCQLLYPEDVEGNKNKLVDAIHYINELRKERDLPPPINTPLMTTMVVSVQWGETELPRERARLYEACVKAILQGQYISDDPARKELINWGGPWEAQRDWLSKLALEMHLRGKGGAVLREEQVREILSSALSESSLENFLRAVRYRGGLFEERSEFFQFIHLTFQEFLVARLMAKQREVSHPTLNKHVTDSWWREVLLLIYGYLQMDYPPAATDYLKWLSNLKDSDEKSLAGAELAGSAVLEMEKPEPAARRRQAEMLITILMNKEINVPGVLRGVAGRTLARLGDPRFRKDAFELPNEQLLGFVEVPSGNFTMGTEENKIPALIEKFGGEKDLYKWETPQQKPYLQTFYISQYPVTNAQFNAFVEANGYNNPNYWEEAKSVKVWEKDGYVKDGWSKERRNKPYDFGEPFNLPNHPVVGVTWYEALAYTKWLTEQLRTWSGTPESLAQLIREKSWVVTLPSEAQWEKAARGEDGRIFPWENNEIVPNLANYDKASIGTTSAVGCFPGGASPYGVQDMSGNVWEWCMTKWENNYKNYKNDNTPEGNDLRVLRGGSFYDVARYVRCAYRSRDFPDFRPRDFGFRVVLSPL